VGFIKNRQFMSQVPVTVDVGSYQLSIPSGHHLRQFVREQPLRHKNIGIAAAEYSSKYPQCVIIDIGANIGDTGAIISSQCTNELVLVEPSDYFFKFLSLNSKSWKNDCTLINGFLSDGNPIRGDLVHWAGTAYVSNSSDASKELPTLHLKDVTNKSVGLIKCDTDGYDYKILSAAFPFIAEQKSGVLLEVQIRSTSDLTESSNFFTNMQKIGFAHYIVWDDEGHRLCCTSEVSMLTDLFEYQLSIFKHNKTNVIYNYDILCINECDEDIYSNIRNQTSS